MPTHNQAKTAQRTRVLPHLALLEFNQMQADEEPKGKFAPLAQGPGSLLSASAGHCESKSFRCTKRWCH